MAGFLTGNRSSRVETQDSKRISQAYFPFLAGSRLLLLQAFLHVNCFFSLLMDCTDSQQGGSSEPDWLHQEARAVLSPLLSPPCDSRATEAITWVKLVHDLWEVHQQPAPHPRALLAMVRRSGCVSTGSTDGAARGWYLWTGQEVVWGWCNGHEETMLGYCCQRQRTVHWLWPSNKAMFLP